MGWSRSHQFTATPTSASLRNLAGAVGSAQAFSKTRTLSSGTWVLLGLEKKPGCLPRACEGTSTRD